MSTYYLLFDSTHAVIKSERLCRSENIPCTIIPVPRTISSNCGMAIELTDKELPAVEALLGRNRIEFRRHEAT